MRSRYFGSYPALADEASKSPAPPPSSQAPAADDDSPKAEKAQVAKPNAVSVAQLLRDAAALRALLTKKSPQIAAADARIAQAQADVGAAHLLPNPTVDVTSGGFVVGETNPKGLNYGQTGLFDVGPVADDRDRQARPAHRGREQPPRVGAASAQATTQDVVGDARETLGKVAYYAARSALLEEGATAARKGVTVENAKLTLGGTAGRRLRSALARGHHARGRGRARQDGARGRARRVPGAPARALRRDRRRRGRPRRLRRGARRGHDGRQGSRAAPTSWRCARTPRHRRATPRSPAPKAIPDPTIRVGYTHDLLTLAGNQANVLSVSVSLPLPIFDHGQHDAAKATARANELARSADALTVVAASDATSLRTKTTYLQKALGTMKKDAIPKAQSVVRGDREAFSEGQIGLTDLLLARRAYLGLRLAEIDLSYEHFTTRSALRRALGIDSVSR